MPVVETTAIRVPVAPPIVVAVRIMSVTKSDHYANAVTLLSVFNSLTRSEPPRSSIWLCWRLLEIEVLGNEV
jgi:hypothetical protein